MARMGAVPGRRDHGPRGLLPEPSGVAAAGLDAEAGAALRAELVVRGGDPGRRAPPPALQAAAVVPAGREPACLRKRRHHLLRHARRAPPRAVPRARGPAVPGPLPDPHRGAAAAGAAADPQGGPGQPDRRVDHRRGRWPAELAVPHRPLRGRHPALRADQAGLRRLPRRRPARLRGRGAPARGPRHPAGLVPPADREPAGGARGRQLVRADAAGWHLHDRQPPERELARRRPAARRRGTAPLDACPRRAERGRRHERELATPGPARGGVADSPGDPGHPDRPRQGCQPPRDRGRVGEQRRAAITDGLTGLYNRRFFEATLALEAEQATRSGRDLGLLVLDVDHFKRINDSYGHQAGDRVLRELATRLTASIRGGDVVARYGGEEFVVLLRDTTLDALPETAERLRSAVGDVPIVLSDGIWLAITVSVGGATCPSTT